MATKPKRPRKRKAPAYNPVSPQYGTQPEFDAGVRNRAQSQLDPVLQDISQRRSEADRAHGQRQQEMQGWYNFQNQALQAGQGDLQKSMEGLLKSSGVMGADAQNALQGAMNKQTADQQAQATAMGGSAQVADPSVAQALAAYGTSNQAGLAGQLAGIVGRGGAQVGIGGIAGREAGQAEDRRYQGSLDSLTGERTNAMGRLPGLLEEARAAIGGEEMQRRQQRFAERGQRFQEGLAGDQFGLSVRQQKETERTGRTQRGLARREQGETERSNRAQEGLAGGRMEIDWAQVDNTRRQLANEAGQAGSQQEVDVAKAKAEQFNSGISILNEFFSPTKDEQGKKRLRKSYQSRTDHGYDELLDRIMSTTGMGPVLARKVLMTAPNDRWRKRARREVTQIADRRRAGQPGGAADPGHYGPNV